MIVFFSFNDFFLVLDDIVGSEWGTVLRLIIGYKRRCTIINIEVGSEWYLCGTPFCRIYSTAAGVGCRSLEAIAVAEAFRKDINEQC